MITDRNSGKYGSVHFDKLYINRYTYEFNDETLSVERTGTRRNFQPWSQQPRGYDKNKDVSHWLAVRQKWSVHCNFEGEHHWYFVTDNHGNTYRTFGFASDYWTVLMRYIATMCNLLYELYTMRMLLKSNLSSFTEKLLLLKSLDECGHRKFDIYYLHMVLGMFGLARMLDLRAYFNRLFNSVLLTFVHTNLHNHVSKSIRYHY